MDVAEGRQITTHTSVFVRLPHSRPGKNRAPGVDHHPVDLTSNVAVAVNPELTYLKVRQGDWMYYVAKATTRHDRLQDLQVEGKHESHKLPSIPHHPQRKRRRRGGRRMPGRDLLGLGLRRTLRRAPAQNTPGGVFP